MTSFRQRVLVAATAIIAFVPAVAFAQLSAIKGGVDAAAGAAQLRTASCTGTDCATRIIGQVVNVALGFSGVILLGLLIYAGFLWMTAQEQKDVQKAQDIIKNAVAGLILIMASYAIAAFVLSQLSNAVGGSGGGGGAPTSGAASDSVTPGSTPEVPRDGAAPATPTGGSASTPSTPGSAPSDTGLSAGTTAPLPTKRCYCVGGIGSPLAFTCDECGSICSASYSGTRGAVSSCE